MRLMRQRQYREWRDGLQGKGRGDEPDPGTGHNGWGCFVPDLTRLAALPCGEARHGGL